MRDPPRRWPPMGLDTTPHTRTSSENAACMRYPPRILMSRRSAAQRFDIKILYSDERHFDFLSVRRRSGDSRVRFQLSMA